MKHKSLEMKDAEQGYIQIRYMVRIATHACTTARTEHRNVVFKICIQTFFPSFRNMSTNWEALALGSGLSLKFSEQCWPRSSRTNGSLIMFDLVFQDCCATFAKVCHLGNVFIHFGCATKQEAENDSLIFLRTIGVYDSTADQQVYKSWDPEPKFAIANFCHVSKSGMFSPSRLWACFEWRGKWA